MAVMIAFRESPLPFGPLRQGEKNFCRYHDLIAFVEIAQSAAHDFLAGAIRVSIGGIEKVNSQFERAAQKGTAGLFIERPRMRAATRYSVSHAAQAQPRDIQSGPAQFRILHRLRSHFYTNCSAPCSE